LTVKILYQDCDPELAKDRTLPYTAYIVTYEIDGVIKYDIVQCNKKLDIFDHYWDHYRGDFKSFKQTEGRVNPRLYGNQPPEEKKKKR
jgi:hypothetical protein